MANRVAYERGTAVGHQVGYTIRFEERCSEETVIKYVTDGILVRECMLDRDLMKYNFVILDEAHERSLDTDLLFGLVKEAVIRRKGSLRLIVTSATLNVELFSKYFYDCPSLKVSGRCYNVDILHGYCPKEKRMEACVNAVIKIHMTEAEGDVLVFLCGFEECENACALCYQKLEFLANKGKKVPPITLMPLYGAQSTEDQSLAFKKAPDNTRKVIFSTNIAETSLTVNGIVYVVDCGFVKQKSYNAITGMV
jgi:ATP-dependent RNA helicase DHX8/PRP22